MTEKPVSKEVAVVREIQNEVLAKVKDMEFKKEIFFPANYSPENALKSAFLIIQETKDMFKKPALEVCTTISISNALLDMVVQGLSPAKKQCYFVVRDGKLCMDRSYFGTVAVTKRLSSVIDVFAQPIFENDIFEYKIVQARKVVTKHEQKIDNIDISKIKGAYSTIVYKDTDGEIKESSEVMTMTQVKQSWEKSKNKERKIHNETPDQMAVRTVLNRGCKIFINASDDSNLDHIIQSFNRTDGREDIEEIKEVANTEEIIIDRANVIDNKPEEPKYEPIKEDIKF